MDLENLDKQASGPGIGAEILVIAHEDITVHAAPDPAGTTLASKAQLVGDYTLTAGKFWKKIYTTQDFSGFKAEPKGEKDNFSLLCYVELSHPGVAESMAGFIEENKPLVALVPDVDCDSNKYFVIGTKCTPASINEPNFDTSQTGSDAGKKWTLKIEAVMKGVRTYTGATPLA